MHNSRPQAVGKYEVLELLGRGGMGVVYRARDKRIGRDVAIKMLTDGFVGDPEMLARFYQEAGHTGTLRHPNIVTVYDVSDQDGMPYIVMEYLDGVGLDRVIQQDLEEGAGAETFDLSMRLEVMGQVCSALAYAHRRGVIHRDIKPANVIVQRDGMAKLLDFGIARAERRGSEEGFTRTGLLIGTPPYMAPERLRNESFDGRSDIFSAGVVLYQLLTGALPFNGEHKGLVDEILHKPAPPLSQHLQTYPPQLDQILERSLAKSVADRYLTADEMGAELKEVCASLREQRIAGLLDRAQELIRAERFGPAQERLLELLRIDSQHLRGKQMLSEVERRLHREQQARRVERLCQQGEALLAARDWDEAHASAAEALKIDSANERAQNLAKAAGEGRNRKEQIGKWLRLAEASRRAGRYDDARREALQAAALDGENSKIHALCTLLDQEAAADARRQRVDALRCDAESDLEAGRYAEALKRLEEAQTLEPADTGVHRLREALTNAMAQERRRKQIAELKEEATLAFTLEQARTLAEKVREAIEQAGTDPALLRLKAHLDQRIADFEQHKIVNDTAEACRSLPPQEAFACVQRALAHAPADPRLLDLMAALERRSKREGQNRAAAERVAAAKAAMNAQRHADAIQILEGAEREGIVSPDISELLAVARTHLQNLEEEQSRSRILDQAHRLAERRDHQSVIDLLQPVLRQREDPELRRIYENAKTACDALAQRVSRALQKGSSLLELRMYDAAVRSLEEQGEQIRSVPSLQTALDAARVLRHQEWTLLETLGAAYAAFDQADPLPWGKLEEHMREGPQAGLAARLAQRLRDRRATICNGRVAPALQAARAALNAGVPADAQRGVADAAQWSADASPELRKELHMLQSQMIAGDNPRCAQS